MLLETERLILRPFVQEDVNALNTFWGDDEVMIYCGGVSNPSKERFLKTINFYAHLYETKGYTVFAIIEKESNTLIGGAGFNPTDSEEEIELIYHFAKKAWGKGYATEAASACMLAAKKLEPIRRIVASVDPKNHGSMNILEKLGFIYQGLKWFEDTGQEEHVYYYPLQ